MGYIPQFISGDATPLGKSLVTATPTQAAARDLLGLGEGDSPAFAGLEIQNQAIQARGSAVVGGSNVVVNFQANSNNTARLFAMTGNTPYWHVRQSTGRFCRVSPLNLGFGISGTNPNTFLAPDFDGAPNILEQRNDTNAQTFNLYKTFTSATNFERLQFSTSGAAYRIGSAVGSAGGVGRNLEIGHALPDGTWLQGLVVGADGNVGIATQGQAPASALQIGRNVGRQPNHFITLNGYDNFGMRWRAHNTWGDYYFTAGWNTGLRIYNLGSNNRSNTLEIGNRGGVNHAEGVGNALLVMRTQDAHFLGVGQNNSGQYVLKMGIQGTVGNYAGHAYLDASHGANPDSYSRFWFRNSGEFEAMSLKLTGLPTADPASAGQVWNDNGTLKISLG